MQIPELIRRPLHTHTPATGKEDGMWYAIKAYNSETLYGWTTNPAVADAAEAMLNAKRDVNVYSAEPLDAELAESALADYQGLLFDDDTTVEDFALAQNL